MEKIKVLVVGCGNMGTSHARAYHEMDDFEIVGLVSRNPESRDRLSAELGGQATFSDYATALSETQPDAVSINTYPDTHAAYVKMAFEANAHVFVEKPLATTVEEAQEIVDMAERMNRKMVIGYILRVHPSWSKFIELARDLGKPLVMRMNLNQQSSGERWTTHKSMMQSMSPVVDCGVHYVDIMCSMTESRPISVSAIGVNLTPEIPPEMYNYGQLQVKFEDGSVGWYESGWGPMISETAFFIKDAIGPKGSVSISDESRGESDNIEGHIKTGGLKLHHSSTDEAGNFTKKDEWVTTVDEPDHDGLCKLEQELFLKVIREDLDMSEHLNAAVNSLRIVLAADKAVRTGEVVHL